MEALLIGSALVQAIGAIIGAGGSVISELVYVKAVQDGRISGAERAHLAIVARGLRIGMLLLLLGSIALVALDYVFQLPMQPALTAEYWLLMTLALTIIGVTWALSKRRLPFWLGSAAAFVGWWFAALLTVGRLPELGYGGTLAAYLVTTGIVAGLFAYARMLITPKI